MATTGRAQKNAANWIGGPKRTAGAVVPIKTPRAPPRRPNAQPVVSAEFIAPAAPDANDAVKVRQVKMTPTMATELLSANQENRSISQSRVEGYVRTMRAGGWYLNNQGIAVGVDGKLYDGQHRLWAVVESGVTIDVILVTGLTGPVRETIDIGRARAVSDVLKFAGDVPSPKKVMGWLNMQRRLLTKVGGVISPAEARSMYLANRSAIDWGLRTFAGSSLAMSATTISGAMVFAHPTKPEAIESFAEQCISGTELVAGDPAHTLRFYVLERMPIMREDQRPRAIKILRCAMAAVLGERILRTQASEEALAYFRRAHETGR